ncbi:hypothetical protein, partial [uncultured Campylobacter sp.]|uniref:hypothetical protein n=1 Tax=uncultured Campylobacter sp. TaxID=218934 RepID=UPI0025D51E3C
MRQITYRRQKFLAAKIDKAKTSYKKRPQYDALNFTRAKVSKRLYCREFTLRIKRADTARLIKNAAPILRNFKC